MIALNDIKKIYFVGIGGIGMSALARYFNFNGVDVHGYDRTATALTKRLEEEGMAIHYEENVDLIPEGIDLVVYTPAVPKTHAELEHFWANDFPVKKRAEVLGIISRSKKTAAIAGTHGKTTTTSMLAHLVRSGGIDATAFLGGIAKNLDSNFAWGASDWVVVEADEYDRSFLHLHPDTAVVLSMDEDHLDIYGDKDGLENTGYKAFVKQIKPGGKMWVQADWHVEMKDIENVGSYGVEKGAIQAQNIVVKEGHFQFDYVNGDLKIEGLQLRMPGRHNVENATAAITLALEMGVEANRIPEGIKTFKGIKRRFDIAYQEGGQAYVDDYAHHPTELKAAIRAAKSFYPMKKITGIFQPHLFSRTRDFLDGFAEALDLLDETILLDIYPAREQPIPGITSRSILIRMRRGNKCILTKAEALQRIYDKPFEVLMTLGAGDIDRMVEPITEFLNSKR
ncbi:MAG: UDP-N-acetylmuramate--L-alanine ligase [Bacteroidota bacterium]